MKKHFTDSYSNLSKKINTKEGAYYETTAQGVALSPLEIDNIINSDGLLQIILEAPVLDSFLTGIETEDKNILDKFNEFTPTIKKAITTSRGFGACYVIQDITGNFKPLSPTSIDVYDIELNPLRDDYLEAKSLQLIDTSEEIAKEDLIIISEHATDNFKKNNYGRGVSLTRKIIHGLIRYDISLSQATDILNQLNLSVIKFRDLTDTISEAGGEDSILKRLDVINTLASNNAILAIDGEDEYINVTKSLGGVTDVIKENAIFISAISKIPYSRLYGKTVSGIGQTNDNDLKNYFDTVVSDIRENYVKPLFNKMCEMHGIEAVEKWSFKNIVEPSKLDELKEKELDINNSLKLLEQGVISIEDLKSKFKEF